MLEGFDFTILDDPEFKEDSVREEIIVPLLSALGYTASGPNKIIRSKSITHPFVYIGSKRSGINIIPDYLLKVNEKNVLIIDAKSPSENIRSGKNPEQAFCYSIHPEVRTSFYTLCNGRELVVFNISQVKPILCVQISKINEQWKYIYNSLSPIALTKPHLLSFQPDFGVWSLKSGQRLDSEFHFVGAWVNSVAKVEDDLYTLFSNLVFNEQESYAASFDFNKNQYNEFLKAVPSIQRERITNSLTKQPYHIRFETKEESFEIIIHAKFGETVITNNDESYCPFSIVKFSPMF